MTGPLQSFGRWAPIKRLGRPLSLSVLSQVVSSATNLAFGLYLVRGLVPAEFGLYSIGFAISLFYFGIGNGLFLVQMVAHTPDKPAEERSAYAARMFAMIGLFSLASVCLAALALLVCLLAWAEHAHDAAFVLAAAIASVGFLLKDFFVRYAFNVRKEKGAVAVNIAVMLALLILLVGAQRAELGLSAPLALALYGIAHCLAALTGFLTAALPMKSVRWTLLHRDLIEAWGGGKWVIAQNLVFWLRTQAQTYVTLLIAGPAGVGLVNASRLLISPVLFLLPAISQVMVPRLSVLRNDVRRCLTITLIAGSGLLLTALLYGALLLANLGTLAAIVLGEQYASHPAIGVLTLIWCAVMCAQVVHASFSSLAQAAKMFRDWAHANFVAALVAATAAAGLGAIMAIPGAVLGALAGDLTLVVFGYWLFHCRRRSSNGTYWSLRKAG